MIDRVRLRHALCRWVHEPEAIRRVYRDAVGNDHLTTIDWTGAARDIWERVLDRCLRGPDAATRAELLIEAIRHDYPEAFPDGVPQREPPRARSSAQAAAPAATVTVVGVATELDAALAETTARLATLPGLAVRRHDAAAGASPAADCTVLVLGARTGGTTALADAIDRAALVLRQHGAPIHAAPPDEAITMLGLWRHPGAVEFTTPREAADLALRAVHAWQQARRAPDRPPGDDPDPPVPRDWERAWLTARVEQWRVGRHGPLAARARGQRLDRAEIYVPLHAEATDAWLDADGMLVMPAPSMASKPPRRHDTHATDGIDGIDAMREREDTHPAPLQRLACHPDCTHLVIEGPPGAGKTVLLQHIAHALAAWHLGAPPPAHPLDLDALRGDRPTPPIPLLVEASALAGCGGLGDLIDALAATLDNAVGAPVDRDQLRAGLAAGRYLVLIDALDEVGGQGARDCLAALLVGWAARPDHQTRFVLTTRPTAWRGSVRFGAPLRLVRAAQMSTDEAHALVDRWAAAQTFDAAWAAGAKAALAEIAQRHAGLDPGHNPLLLVCALIVYGEAGSLPDSAARLYDRIVEILCDCRRSVLDPDVRRQSLQALFYALQDEGGARTAVGVDHAARALHTAAPDRYPHVDAARDALDRLYEDTGLLQFEAGDGAAWQVRAWHRSFQEYFAARALAERGDAVEVTTAALVTSGRAADPEWEGVMRFVAGLHARRAGCAPRHVETLHQLAVGHPRRGRLLGLAATALREYRDAFPGHALYGTLPGEIVEDFEQDGINWPLADRLLALEALGGLGDPRLARPMFVPVEGGMFTMGGDERAWEPAPAHPVRISALHVGWRPVVVADFAPFVEQGWPDAQWWTAGRGEDDGDAPGDWAVQLHHPNRSVTGVSWYAARAFCRWASDTGHAAGRWGAPGPVDLPTDAEWEYIARGTGRVYPWGDDPPGDGDAARAAYSPGRYGEGELVLDAATPVGAFPAGHRGPLVDLAGNVYEWCLDAHRSGRDRSWPTAEATDPLHMGSPAVDRVVRGGSWVGPSQVLRAAHRFGDHPQYRVPNLGFRLVCRVSREHG